MFNYPYEHSYYNFLAGNDVESCFELDYWDLSVKQALEAVAEDAGQGTVKTVAAFDVCTFWGIQGNYEILRQQDKEAISLMEDLELWEQADYVIVNTSYAYIYGKDEYEKVKENYRLVDRMESYGNIICEVYQKTAP